MIVVDGLTTTMAGVGAGLILAAATTRALAAILFGVSAYDLGVFGMTAAALATVAVIASYIPAHRAACVDPVVALRAE
jgi:ABC-type lipoprotein release transport system permease subunit